MECNKWDENGLLFMARELSQPLASEFEKHLISCQSCSSELNQYTLEKKQFYATAILCESTPEHLDNKIISLCSKPMVPTSLGLFSMPWVKRAVFSALVFALGVGAEAISVSPIISQKHPPPMHMQKHVNIPSCSDSPGFSTRRCTGPRTRLGPERHSLFFQKG